MKLPTSAADAPVARGLPELSDEYIRNPYHGKEHLSLLEAYDLLSIISAQVLADGLHRYGQTKHSHSI